MQYSRPSEIDLGMHEILIYVKQMQKANKLDLTQQKRICLECRRHQFHPWVGKIPWRRKSQPTPVFLPENPVDRGA